jgi:beta-aspartyl-peptidase (threonine type)
MNPSISRLRIAVALLLAAVAVVLTIHMRKGGEKPEEAIRKVLDDQVEAWNRGDLDGFMQGYWNSDELTFFSDDHVEHGWQETFDRYRLRYQSQGKEMGTLKFEELHVDPTGPKSAAVRGRWQLTFKDGKTSGGLFTLLLREEPQGWRIVHDHTSAKRPPEVPLPAPGGDR